MKVADFTESQLARALDSLMKEVSIEIGEMVGACLRDSNTNPLSTRAQCQKLERSIENHRDVAKSERRHFAAAAADGLLESLRRLRESLQQKRPGKKARP